MVMYSIDVMHDTDFMGDFKVVFRGVDHSAEDRKRIAHALREIANRLEDSECTALVAN